MKWQRWHALAGGAALVAILFVAFRKGDGGGSLPDAGDLADPPVIAPENVLADVYVASPNSSWARLQRGVGGAVGILPATLPGVIVALTDLDVTLAGELDGTAPMYGVLAGEPTDPQLAFAIKLVDARRARGVLADGDTSRYRSQPMQGAGQGMTQLVPLRPTQHERFEIAITNNGYLVAARTAADLAKLGPYITRTLPKRPAPTESSTAAVIDIPRSALETKLRPKVESVWKEGKSYLLSEDERMRRDRGGRAPDFGDPAAIVGALDAMLTRRLSILGDLEHIKISLEVTDDATVLTALLTPLKAEKEKGPAAQWVESMKTGDAAPALGFTVVSALTMSTRDAENERTGQAEELKKTLASALGSRLKDGDREKINESIDAMTKARDDAFGIAVSLEEPSGMLLKAHVRDEAAANKSLRAVVDLAKADPFKDLLRVKDVTSTTEDLPGLGKISVATITRESKGEAPLRRQNKDGGAPADDKSKKSSTVGAAWVVEKDNLLVGLGAEPQVTLKVGAKADHPLSDEPSLKRFVSGVGSDASTVVIAQPLRIDPKRANLPLSPLAIAVGKKGGDAFVRFDISDGLWREAARWQMGF